MEKQVNRHVLIQTQSADYWIIQPRKFIVKNGFGAEPHRAWLEIYNQDIDVPVQLGDRMLVFVADELCFEGTIYERRLDSIDDYITYLAEWKPQSAFALKVHHRFENQTIAEMLEWLTAEAGINVEAASFAAIQTQLSSVYTLELSNKRLFACIDLLAKLAGNWLWDVTLARELRFRPASQGVEHHVFLKQDHYVINLRQNAPAHYARLIVEGGLVGAEPLELGLDLSPQAQSDAVLKVIARSIVTQEGLVRLATAIIQQGLQPNYSHYIDKVKTGWTIQAGDTVRFSVGDYPLLPEQNFFRVVQRELTYAHEQLTTRLYLTSGYESTLDYFDQLTKELPLPGYMIGRIGPFQLDVSALDTPAHLDGVT